jgi:hypothetical protein
MLLQANTGHPNRSWWREVLAAPVVVPDFEAISRHVCGMKAACVSPSKAYRKYGKQSLLLKGKPWPYFPTECREKGGELMSEFEVLNFDAIGHVGIQIVNTVQAEAKRNHGLLVERARFFGQDVALSAVYLRDVEGLGNGFAPSLYCHTTKFLTTDLNLSAAVLNGTGHVALSAAAEAKEFYARSRKLVNDHEKIVARLVAKYETGSKLFRDFYECYLVPPLDDWFGFNALPRTTLTPQRVIAETYAATNRSAFVGSCGTADPSFLRVAIHVRLGDVLSMDYVRAQAAAILETSLRLLAHLQVTRNIHVIVVSDSPPRVITSILKGVDIVVGQSWSDGVSHFVDGRTTQLEPGDLDLTFLGDGNPLVALHCIASADLVLGPVVCKDGAQFDGGRCSNFIKFARALSTAGVFHGVPTTAMNASKMKREALEISTMLRRPSTFPGKERERGG